MGISPEAQRWTDEKKRLTDQLFINPDIETSGFPVNPYTPYYRTNNFVQQTLSRIFGYRTDDEKWYPLNVDSLGKLQVSTVATIGASIFLRNREAKDVTIFTDRVLSDLTAATHDGVDFSGYSSKLIMVKSTGAVTVYPQASNDKTTWYDLVDSSGNALSVTVNRVTKAIEWTEPAHYFRCVVVNTSGAAVTVSMLYHGIV